MAAVRFIPPAFCTSPSVGRFAGLFKPVNIEQVTSDWGWQGMIVLILLLGVAAVLFSFLLRRQVQRATATLRNNEQKLRESQAMLFQVLDTVPLLIFWKDCNSVYMGCNQMFSSLLGYSPQEIRGKTDFDLPWSTDMAEFYRAKDREILASDQSHVHTLELINYVDGRPHWIETHKIALRDAEGHVLGILGVQEDVTERKHAEEEILALNTGLEQRVAERTQQLSETAIHLEASNRELEAFAYSVSHDLRSPLRSLDGFSLALLEEYGDKLDGVATNYLNRIRLGAQNMAQLIDDLLRLSRFTRAAMQVSLIDLSKMALTIMGDLQDMQPERQVEVIIAPDLYAQGDQNLIGVVMQNLLGNAWKFTSTHATARIQFGMLEQEGEKVYFVKDDGAGLDMTYANKLFGVFQRLHTVKDFPGTGIGLATVQRIILRHGGRVWIEGDVEQGASIYFTLPG